MPTSLYAAEDVVIRSADFTLSDATAVSTATTNASVGGITKVDYPLNATPTFSNQDGVQGVLLFVLVLIIGGHLTVLRRLSGWMLGDTGSTSLGPEL